MAYLICKSVLTEVLASGMRYFGDSEDSLSLQIVSLTHTTCQQLLVNNLAIMETKLNLHHCSRKTFKQRVLSVFMM